MTYLLYDEELYHFENNVTVLILVLMAAAGSEADMGGIQPHPLVAAGGDAADAADVVTKLFVK